MDAISSGIFTIVNSNSSSAITQSPTYISSSQTISPVIITNLSGASSITTSDQEPHTITTTIGISSTGMYLNCRDIANPAESHGSVCSVI